MKYYRKDWILYQEVANEKGTAPKELIPVNFKTDDVETNKHVPFVVETKNGYKVSVGKNAIHDVNEEHHIMFIELNVDDKYVYKYMINLNDKPITEFNVPKGKKVEAIAFCNLHGLFKNEL